jgi:hypothetical protein
MNLSNLPSNISEDTVIRLRAKMEDLTYKRYEERGSAHIAFRVPGESIDLLNSLEYLGEFLSEEELEGADKIVIISDREVEIANASIMEKKIEAKRSDDEQLYSELRDRLKPGAPPIVFTTENDILELYRVAFRTRGSSQKDEDAITEDVKRMEVPREGSIFYLIYDDGYRKMGRPTFERMIEEERSRSLTKVQVARDPDPGSRTVSGPAKTPARKSVVVRGDRIRSVGEKAFMRDILRSLSSLGYREDPRFSRPDMDQILLVGMKGPTILLKISREGEDISPFLRVLDHRRDVLGILLSDAWTPTMEAMANSRGFIYLTGERVVHATDVVSEVLGGSVS